jgi:hypothetical protein
MALNTPDTFKRLFIKSVKPNGDLVIKHKDTSVPCQIAIKIDTYSDSGGGGCSKNAKQKGGSGRAMTRRNKKYSKSRSKSRFSKSRRNKTMRR